MNIKVYVILIIALLGTVNPLISYSGIIPPDRPSHSKENEITDSNKLFKHISYKPETRIETGIKNFINWYERFYKKQL